MSTDPTATDTTATDTTTPATDAPSTRFAGLMRNFDVVIAILLGVVSTTTAYASFQAALYDSQMAGAYQQAGALSTEAESLYLEGNQQYMQDTQVLNRLTELSISSQSSDPAIAADADLAYETLMFQAVSEELAAAIEWAAAENEADEEYWTSPLNNEDYLDSLFASYTETKEEALSVTAKGDEYNSLSDRLTLNTVLMAISLFLLGIGAVVQRAGVQLVLAATGTVIFVVAGILTAAIPFVGL